MITVLVILLILSVVIVAILSLVRIENRFVEAQVNAVQNQYKLEGAIFRALDQQYLANLEDLSRQVDFEQENLSVSMVPFGGFLLSRASFITSDENQITALIGLSNSKESEAVLSVQDSPSGIKITGRTILKGLVEIPGNDIETIGFEGEPFKGEFDISFSSQDSPNGFKLKLPAFIQSQYEKFDKMLSASGYISIEDDRSLDNVKVIDDRIYEGSTKLTVIRSRSPYVRVISSDTLIVENLESNSHLLFYARNHLEIRGNSKFTCQCLSEGSITIDDNTYLQYPSLVYSSSEITPEDNRVIDITGQSVIDGSVYYPNQTNLSNEKNFRTRIDTNAVVRGQIFSKGMVEMHGKIHGSVSANKFYFYNSPTEYINWIKDAEIDLSKRPDASILPIGTSDHNRYTVIEWN